MIIVHHLNNSRSQRILWMLEELGVPYDVKRYEREPSMQAPASLRAVHPLGKSPVITDGDVRIAESGAIVDYIIRRYGKGAMMPSPGSAEYEALLVADHNSYHVGQLVTVRRLLGAWAEA